MQTIEMCNRVAPVKNEPFAMKIDFCALTYITTRYDVCVEKALNQKLRIKQNPFLEESKII